MRRVRGIVMVGVAVALTAVASGASAAGGPSGSPKGIRLAKTVQSAYGRISVLAYHQSGFVWMLAPQGKSAHFAWKWGAGPVAGWSPAAERGVAVLRGGSVVWWRDDLTPVRCGAGGCASVPVEVVVNHTGAFYAYGDAAKHTCFGRLGGTTPYTYRVPVWGVFGHFRTPKDRGSTVALLTSSYPWTASQTATETDTISLRTHLPFTIRVKVSPDKKGAGKSFGYTTSLRNPPKMPAAPRVKVCRG